MDPRQNVSSRYIDRKPIGSGGMGTVERAYDTALQQHVALKRVVQKDPLLVAQLKREFRIVSQVHHENVARMYELFADDGGQIWCAMELIPGVTFDEWLRLAASDDGLDTSPVDDDATAEGLDSNRDVSVDETIVATSPGRDERAGRFDESTRLAVPSTSPRDVDVSALTRSSGEFPPSEQHGGLAADDEDVTLPARRPVTPGELARILGALKGVARGLSALHSAGILHRDLKPTNIMIRADGHPVLLDFGISETRREWTTQNRRGMSAAGTAGFMAPEQVTGDELGPSCDWYAFGVVLFYALTRTLPFNERSADLTAVRKTFKDPPDPKDFVRWVGSSEERERFEQTLELCRRLIRRLPDERVAGEEVLAFFDVAREEATAVSRDDAADRPFVGRIEQLERLRRVTSSSGRTRLAVAALTGPSGMGKSALLRHLCESVERDGVLLLRGRCYERDRVPFRGIDALVDELAAYLASLDVKELERLRPANLPELILLFPTLASVTPWAIASKYLVERDAAELRRRAFVGLRDLLSLVGRRIPLVCVIDDLQWADNDSIAEIAGIVGSSGAPPISLVLSWREEADVHEPLLDRLAGAARQSGAGFDHVAVGPMPDGEVEELIDALSATRDIGRGEAVPKDVREQIIRESEGVPFLAEQITYVWFEYHDRSLLHASAILESRVDNLGHWPRKTLEAISLHSRPVEVRLLRTAVGLEAVSACNLLSAARFVIVSGDGEMVECCHDRIREVASRRIAESDRTELHERFVTAMEALQIDDPERLAAHLAGTGAVERAADLAVEAGRRAEEGYGFDRAARLYEWAAELLPSDDPRSADAMARAAEAVGAGGRGSEAGMRLLALVDRLPERADELRRRAAGYLIRSGRVDEGLDVVRALFAPYGIKIRRSDPGIIMQIVSQKVATKLDRLTGGPRIGDDEALHLAELLADVSFALLASSPLNAIDLIHRSYRLAQRDGPGFAPLRARASAVMVLAGLGFKHKRPEDLFDDLAEAELLVAESDDPAAEIVVLVVKAILSVHACRFRDVRRYARKARRLIEKEAPHLRWEHWTTQFVDCSAAGFLGRLRTVSETVPGLVDAASRDGDLQAEVRGRLLFNLSPELITDRPDASLAVADEAWDSWVSADKGVFRFHYFLSRIDTLLYMRRSRDARETLDALLGELDASPASNPVFHRVQIDFAVARTLLLELDVEQQLPDSRLESAIKRLADSESPLAGVFLPIVLAQRDLALGRRDEALEHAFDAARQSEALQLDFFRAVMERWTAGISGDAAGLAGADAAIRDLGAAAPGRLARVVTPIGP